MRRGAVLLVVVLASCAPQRAQPGSSRHTSSASSSTSGSGSTSSGSGSGSATSSSSGSGSATASTGSSGSGTGSSSGSSSSSSSSASSGSSGTTGGQLVCDTSGAQDCSAFSGTYQCADLPTNFASQVNAAVEQVLAQHPEYFDTTQGYPCCPLVLQPVDYANAVVGALNANGLCAAIDPNDPPYEITVKLNGACDEGYAILTSANIARHPPHYQGSCVPAWQ